jgi:hypothetical protein
MTMAGTKPPTEHRTREVETDIDQQYFWSDDWQAGEREASEQLEAGEGTVYLTDKDFLRDLDPERAKRDNV